MGKKDSSVRETNSGVKKEGNWEDITDFAEEVEEVIENSDLDESSVEEYRRWRPRKEEAENEVKKKTVEEAALKETKLEKESKGPIKDIEEAKEKAVEAGKKAGKREMPEKELKDASVDLGRPLVSELLKFFRTVERFIYSKIMLRDHTYYFDTKDFSANMKSKKGEYQMEINVPEEESREKVKEELGE